MNCLGVALHDTLLVPLTCKLDTLACPAFSASFHVAVLALHGRCTPTAVHASTWWRAGAKEDSRVCCRGTRAVAPGTRASSAGIAMHVALHPDQSEKAWQIQLGQCKNVGDQRSRALQGVCAACLLPLLCGGEGIFLSGPSERHRAPVHRPIGSSSTSHAFPALGRRRSERLLRPEGLFRSGPTRACNVQPRQAQRRPGWRGASRHGCAGCAASRRCRRVLWHPTLSLAWHAGRFHLP